MSDVQFVILIMTATVSVLGLVISIINLDLGFKNRRNVLREKVYDEQFKLFLRLNDYSAKIEDGIGDLNKAYTNNDRIISQLYHLVIDMDLYLSKHEVIIPEYLYKHVFEFVDYNHHLIQRIMEAPQAFDDKKIKEYGDVNIDLQFYIMDYLGVDKLNEENMKLVRCSRKKTDKTLELCHQIYNEKAQLS